MRVLFPVFLMLIWVFPAKAGAVDVTVHPARRFGYFVGDLIRARIEITTPPDAILAAASLPRPGPLGASLDLKDVSVDAKAADVGKRWDIELVYQNFYVALDVRNIEIPAFDLRFGEDTVTVPAWIVSVAPLRQIGPEKQEQAEDYLRPDPPLVMAQEAQPRGLTLAFAVLSLLALAAVARDRAWPPFQKRRARIFNSLARELAVLARGDVSALPRAMQSMHRTIDLSNGGSVLAEDVPRFLSRRPEFATLRPSFDRFFSASRRTFFSSAGEELYSFAELFDFAKALARQERVK